MLAWAKTLQAACESFLRIDASLSAETRLRSRIIYLTGALFFVLQIANIVSIYALYDGWDIQHWVAVGASFVFAGVTLLLRWTKSPWIFGTIYTALPLIAIGTSALIGQGGMPAVGIATPLLPLLVVSVSFLAFMGTRWHSLAYLTLGIALIVLLYYVAASGTTGLERGQHYQRAFQGVLSLILVSIALPIASHLIYSNLKALEDTVARARAAEAAKTQLLGTMSHEIRTPLNGVIAMADMVSRAEVDADTRASLNLLQASADSLLDVLNSALDRAKSEGAALLIQAKPFDPAALMGDVTGLFAAAARDKDLWLGTVGTDALPDRLVGDAAHLRQVLNNLVGNAVKFTQSGGIRLGAVMGETRDGAADILFYVQDTGLGIAPEEQGRIFDRFEQSASAQATSVKGTGLGLAICQDIVTAMGGLLNLRSEVGRGSTFHFTLRLAVQQELGRQAA